MSYWSDANDIVLMSLLLTLKTYFMPCSSVFIDNFEHVIDDSVKSKCTYWEVFAFYRHAYFHAYAYYSRFP